MHRTGLPIEQFEGIGFAIGAPARGKRGDAVVAMARDAIRRVVGSVERANILCVGCRRLKRRLDAAMSLCN